MAGPRKARPGDVRAAGSPGSGRAQWAVGGPRVATSRARGPSSVRGPVWPWRVSATVPCGHERRGWSAPLVPRCRPARDRLASGALIVIRPAPRRSEGMKGGSVSTESRVDGRVQPRGNQGHGGRGSGSRGRRPHDPPCGRLEPPQRSAGKCRPHELLQPGKTFLQPQKPSVCFGLFWPEFKGERLVVFILPGSLALLLTTPPRTRMGTILELDTASWALNSGQVRNILEFDMVYFKRKQNNFLFCNKSFHNPP